MLTAERLVQFHRRGIPLEYRRSVYSSSYLLLRRVGSLLALSDTVGKFTDFLQVDATVEQKLAEKYGVEGYPTIKWFVKGKASDYGSNRDV